MTDKVVKKNLFAFLDELHEKGIDPATCEQEIWDTYGRKVAVMVLDSSGFSRVSESHGIVHFLSRLMRKRKVTQAVLESFNAFQIKFEADNVFAYFDSVDDAIKSAFAIHKTINDSQLMLTDDEPFAVCIGIGYGDLLHSETLEGYFGNEMNIASKLGEDTADRDETLLTKAAFDAAEESLTEGFETRQIEMSGLNILYYAHCSER